MRNNSNEEIFDILIGEALIEKWDKELDELKLQTTPHEFSRNFNKRIQRIRFSIASKNNIKKAGKIALKAVATIAIVMGVCFGGLLTQPEIYAAVTNVIKNVFEGFDSYQFNDNEITLENFNADKQLGYVPEGYWRSSGDYAPGFVSLTYIDSLDNKIVFDYFIANGSQLITDNEHCNSYEFSKDNVNYNYYESTDKDFPSALIWYDKVHVYCVYAHLSKDELVKIAENIK